MSNKLVYQVIASLVVAIKNCARDGNEEWQRMHTERLYETVNRMMPSGSGFDTGTQLDIEKSSDVKLVFHTNYHHMNDGGFYDGWTRHTVTVRPNLALEIEIIVSGRNRNDIKEYIGDEFHNALTNETTVTYERKREAV
jgi:hypothetical protein